MANLIGTAPNQVPTNGSLGTMAFQDADNASLENPSITESTFRFSDTGNVAERKFAVSVSGVVGVGGTVTYSFEGIGNYRANLIEVKVLGRYNGTNTDFNTTTTIGFTTGNNTIGSANTTEVALDYMPTGFVTFSATGGNNFDIVITNTHGSYGAIIESVIFTMTGGAASDAKLVNTVVA